MVRPFKCVSCQTLACTCRFHLLFSTLEARFCKVETATRRQLLGLIAVLELGCSVLFWPSMRMSGLAVWRLNMLENFVVCLRDTEDLTCVKHIVCSFFISRCFCRSDTASLSHSSPHRWSDTRNQRLKQPLFSYFSSAVVSLFSSVWFWAKISFLSFIHYCILLYLYSTVVCYIPYLF